MSSISIIGKATLDSPCFPTLHTNIDDLSIIQHMIIDYQAMYGQCKWITFTVTNPPVQVPAP